jgi:HAD superfamily hydrolase (TIGR01509 family)
VPPRPAGLVIFDCDGVLVDSEPISIAVLVRVIADAGGAISEEAAYLRFLGRSMASISEILSADYGFVMTGEHLAAMRRELWRRFREELKPTPGVAAALSRLTVPKCVASSSSPERIRFSLGLTGLLEMLQPNLYSASMVERGKPAPDLFLHAARAMGVRPQDCIVIEDSPAGILAAQRAGMRALAYHGGAHAARAGLAAALQALTPDALFDDMAQLPDLVAGDRLRTKAS